MSAVAIVATRIFDGVRLREGAAVIVDNGRVLDIVPDKAVPSGATVRRAAGTLAPGFIDIQVNGGGGVLFNETPSVDGIRAIGAAHRRFGTTGFLPTLITDSRAKMAAAVEAVRDGLEAGVPGLLGIHLEGPFLNPLRKGVHDPQYMRPIEEEDIRIMTSLGSAGRTLVTIAPEMIPIDTIARLAEADVLVCAGHTAADYRTLEDARDCGLIGFTHLFNAMPPLTGREPGPVGRALDDADAWRSLIVDMHHVSAASLRVALAAAGTERAMLITDAMPTVGSSISSFELQGRSVYRKDGRLTTADGTLAGSDLDMATAVRNTDRFLDVGLAKALAMASLNPAEFLGQADRLGRIEPGYDANFVLLDDELNVHATWIDGVEEAICAGGPGFAPAPARPNATGERTCWSI